MGSRAETRTGGRPATTGVIPGDFALSVGRPEQPAPKGWKWIALSDVARLETGHTPSRKHPEYWGGDVPWIGIKDATANHGRTIHDTYQHTNKLGIENSSARILPANTVCLSRTASVGYVVVMGRPMATSQDFVNWICSDKLDYLYLKYVLLSENNAFLRFASGTTHQTIYFPEAKAFHICLPPLAEQRAIAHVLGTLDDKIELNRRMNQTLEAMARAIFKSWFVDFDPVRAKAEGHDPGLPADLAALFPDSFEDSELGEIPKGWRVMPVGEALKAVGGSTPRTGNLAFWEAGEFHWATPKDLSGLAAPILIETERKITKAGVEEISSGLLPTGTVLMSSRAPVGYLALSAIPVAINQGFIAMVCDGPVSNYYALNWCHYNMEEIQQRASGTTFAEISKAAFRPILMLVPSDAVMKRFTQIVEPLYKSIEERVRESRTLAALRDALLPKLLSGEIRVKDAEKFVEAAIVKSEAIEEASRKPGIRKATDEFREAILISALVRALSNDKYPLGRKRYTKICYLIHRKLEHAVEQKYLKKAAGPYSPWTKYKGPERIAIQNGYIKETQKGVHTGFGVGPQIAKIDQYLPRYEFNDVLGWAINNFGKLTNDRLELLSTVDFAVLELKSKGQPVNVKNVRELIAAEPEWTAKLDRAIFSEINIQSIFHAISRFFPDIRRGG